MNENIKSYIKENEVVLWSGQPESYKVLDNTNKGGIIRNVIIFWVISLGISAAHLFSSIKEGMEPKYFLVAALVALAAALSYNAINYDKKIAKSIYVATDKRLFSKIEGHHEISEVPYDKINNSAFVTDSDGHTSLVCGSKTVNVSPSKIRSIASKAARFSDSKVLEAYAMYAIPDADELKSILKDYLPMSK